MSKFKVCACDWCARRVETAVTNDLDERGGFQLPDRWNSFTEAPLNQPVIVRILCPDCQAERARALTAGKVTRIAAELAAKDAPAPIPAPIIDPSTT